MSEPRRALVTGIGGQDGSYLAELLLERGYEVFGIVRRPAREYATLAHRRPDRGRRADLLDQASLAKVLRAPVAGDLQPRRAVIRPASWDEPVQTAEFAAVGVTALLEAVREVDQTIRVYQASSSEIFGEPTETPQSEIDAARAH